MLPTLPDPEAVDHTMLGSVGSGVAQPLSPPPTECHIPRLIPALAARHPAVAGATIAGLVLLVAEHVVRDRVVDRDVVICALVSRCRNQVLPRFSEIERPGRARRSCGRGGVIDPDVVVVAAGAAVAALDLERDPPSIDLE